MKRRSRRNRWKNALVWALVAEVTCVMVICMMVSVVIGGWIGMGILAICTACALWLNLFVQINADIFERRIRRRLRRIDRFAGKAAASIRKRMAGRGEKQPVHREFTYVTFTRP